VVPGLGRALDDTVAMTMRYWLARGAVPGTRLISAPLSIMPGLVVTACARRTAYAPRNEE
jgi:hypothetical protein